MSPVIYFPQLRKPEPHNESLASSHCRFQCAMKRNDRSVESRSFQRVEHFREARLVRITHGGFAIGLNPFGMLDPQIVVNLLLKFGVRVDRMRHGNWPSVKNSSAARDGSDESSARTAYGHRCRKRAPRPGEGIPKGGAHMVALCTTRGQLAYFVALALQQHGQQSALCKGRR